MNKVDKLLRILSAVLRTLEMDYIETESGPPMPEIGKMNIYECQKLVFEIRKIREKTRVNKNLREMNKGVCE